MAPLPQRTLVNFLKGQSHGAQSTGSQMRTLARSPWDSNEVCVHGEGASLDSASWQVQGLGGKVTTPWWPVPRFSRGPVPWP